MIPVIAEIVSEDDQQRVSKLGQSFFVVPDLPQIIKQPLGGKLHLRGGSRRAEDMMSQSLDREALLVCVTRSLSLRNET